MKKICTKCLKNRKLTKFSKDTNAHDGLTYMCKKCNRDKNRTKLGLIAQIYNHQKGSSRKRGHPLPAYTKDELQEWLSAQKKFHKLYANWKRLDYHSIYRPSVDRKDDAFGYSFNNIQLMTWGKNQDKATIDRKKGKLGTQHKTVLQLTKEGIFITEFISIGGASRALNIPQGNISNCCLRNRNSAGGFKWEYKDAS